MRKLTFAGGVVLLLVVLAAGIVAAQGNGPGGGPGTGAGMYPVDTITVSGTGSASSTPDLANVEIGVQTTNADIAAAFAETNSTLDAVIEAIIAAGVAREDVRTTGLDVFAQESFGGPAPESAGPNQRQFSYNVSNRVRVVVRDVALVEDVLTAAVGAGANQIFGLSFGISDTEQLRAEARLIAVERANANAEALAAAAGANVGEIIILEESSGGAGPFDARFMAEAGIGGGGAVIEPGQLSVNLTVTITYRLVR